MRKIFTRILDNIKKTVNGYDGDERADEAADRLRRRTRSGWGVKDGQRGNPRVRLKPWKNPIQRKKVRRRDPTLNRNVTTVGRNNLSLTGQLLNSLKGWMQGSKIIIEAEENRTDGVKNADIIKGQHDYGRYFFELTDKELKGLRSNIKKDLIVQMKKRKRK